jgi:purine-cytosine permease-like protein
MPSGLKAVAERMDALYEFDREAVTPGKLQTGAQFAGLLAGEHVAATEFVIGSFFVLHGVSAADLVLGLLAGNLLAILSWTFLCTPIAVETRLTLYWYLRRIAGPGLTILYNIANAVFYCILAGAMISVSATAIGILLGIPVPALTDVYPTSIGWALLTFTIGLLFTALAILGFEKLSNFAVVCSPWIFVVFIAGAVAALPKLGVHGNLDNLWEIASTRIWTGIPTPGQEKYGLAHIVFFAWFCNLPMHVGLSDMALFRYAKHWTFGLYSAFGIYPGHMLCWMCSGVMVAAIDRQLDPGLMAYSTAGIAGLFGVMLAGWTTANPTMYRVGLALQTITPGWSRWKITLGAGLVTSVLACFPVFFMKLLDYLAMYGILLMPIGAIVVAEHHLFPRLGIPQFLAEKRGWMLNTRALIVWAATLGFCYYLPIHLFFKWLPGWFFALAAYTALQATAPRSASR